MHPGSIIAAALAAAALVTGPAALQAQRRVSWSPDGSGVRRVTQTGSNEVNPVWSPDGKRLAFESDRNGNGREEIYLVDADGSHERRLIKTDANDTYPSWAPDGSKLAICSVQRGVARIRLLDANGSVSADSVAAGCLPAWSPDGKRIVFERQGKEQPGIDVLALEKLQPPPTR